MRKTIYAALLLSVAGLMGLTSCGSSSKTDSTSVAADTVAVSSVDDILAKTDSLVGKTVQVEGVCTHICQHGGKKIFLMGSDDNSTIRVDAGEKIRYRCGGTYRRSRHPANGGTIQAGYARKAWRTR